MCMIAVVGYSYVLVALGELSLRAASTSNASEWPPSRILSLAGGIILACYTMWFVQTRTKHYSSRAML
jgi:hypothetical protein